MYIDRDNDEFRCCLSHKAIAELLLTMGYAFTALNWTAAGSAAHLGAYRAQGPFPLP